MTMTGPILLATSLMFLSVAVWITSVSKRVAALEDRVRRLSGTLLEDLLHGMTGVTRQILKLHAIVLDLWRQRAEFEEIPEEELCLAKARVDDGIADVENRAVEAMIRGQGSPEQLRELVLATRHLTRIADQLRSMPRELQSLGRP